MQIIIPPVPTKVKLQNNTAYLMTNLGIKRGRGGGGGGGEI